MTSSHDALYRAICAEPDEDTPRLAYADLIEEDGDPVARADQPAGRDRRAHFIRAQIALARVPEYDPLWVSARQHEPDAATGHLMAHTLPKKGELPRGYSWHKFEFRRGFPWKAGVLSLAAFVDAGAFSKKSSNPAQ